MPTNKVKSDGDKSGRTNKKDACAIEMTAGSKSLRKRCDSDSSASFHASVSVQTSKSSCVCSDVCLHSAAKNGDLDQIRNLLEKGADPTVGDRSGRTPMHLLSLTECSCVSCIDHSALCMKILLRATPKESLDSKDVNGDTPLSLSLEAQNVKCAQQLIEDGADYTIRNVHGRSPIETMGQKMPNILYELLDKSVTVDRFPPHNQNCVLNLDFRPVAAAGASKTSKGKSSGRSSARCGQRKELSILSSILEGSKTSQELLCHPLIAAFLDLKWQRVRKYFIAMFACHIFWLITYTSYIVKVYLVSCPCEFFSTKKAAQAPEELVHSRRTTSNPFNTNSEAGGGQQGMEKCYLQTGFTYDAAFLIFLTLIMAGYEVFKMILISAKVYFKNKLNYCSWILIFMVFITTGPVVMVEDSKPALWQYEAAALAIFISWAMILVQLGTFPSLGRFVEILGHVLKNFGLSMLTFASLFVAFALSFNVLFPGEDGAFSHFFYAILKVLVMMAGEVDYQDMFYDKEADSTKGPLMGHILYAAFVIIISIVLMNLMIGLTVSDIQTLQNEAEIRRVSRQIRETALLECCAFSKRLPKFVRNILSYDISVLKGPKSKPEDGGTDSAIFQIRPNDRKDKSLPGNLKYDLLQIAVKNYQNASQSPPSSASPSHFHSSATSRANMGSLSSD